MMLLTVTVCVIAATAVALAAWWLIGADSGQHAAARPSRFQEAVTRRYGPPRNATQNVPGPAHCYPAPGRAGDPGLHGPVCAESASPGSTRVPDRAVELHHQLHGDPPVTIWAARAWQTTGENQAAGNWTPRRAVTEDTITDLPVIPADVPLDVQYHLCAVTVDQAIEDLFGHLKPRWAA